MRNRAGNTPPIRTGWLWSLSVMVLFLSLVVVHLVNSISVSRRMELLLVDREDQTPLADAALRITVNTERAEAVTNANGRCLILMPDSESDRVVVHVSTDGYVPVVLNWSGAQDNDPIPSDYTLRLEKGSSIGGTVVDDNGDPLVGAELHVSAAAEEHSFRQRPFVLDEVTFTDPDGAWRLNCMPEKIKDISVRIVHPSYINDGRYLFSGSEQISDLRASTSSIVMTKGIVIEGMIVDADGDPVVQAEVIMSYSGRFGDQLSADADGRGYYRFENCKAGKAALTAKSPWHAPAQQFVNVSEGGAQADFQLEPGGTIRGIVVDPECNPIEGARVRAVSWRDTYTLDWEMMTGPEGQFAWNAAPKDEVVFGFSSEDYVYINDCVLSATSVEYTVTMEPLMVIVVDVIDAATGEPIQNYEPTLGYWTEDAEVVWMGRWRRAFDIDGSRFQHKVRRVIQRGWWDAYVIRIDAHGYKPAYTPSFYGDEGELFVEIELERAEPAGEFLSAFEDQPSASPLLGM